MELVPLTAADGAAATARYFPPGDPRASLLVLPAMGVHARAYDVVARALADRGVAVLVAEHRGGESSSVRARRGVDYGYPELLADLDPAVEALRRLAPGLPVNVLGHSLGGHLGVLGVHRWWTPGARLVVVASGSVHFRAFGGVGGLGILAFASAVSLASRALGVFPGDRLGFGGRQGRRLMVEWSGAALSGRWSSMQAGSADLPVEVLAMPVEGDDWAPPEATRRLVALLPAARTRWAPLAVPPEPARLRPHFRWMRAPAELADRVVAFLAMG